MIRHCRPALARLFPAAALLLTGIAVRAGEPSGPRMLALVPPGSGRVELVEAGRPILGYQFHTVDPGDVLRRVTEANRIYARPRSDYLHPLYGLHGEVLTRDWPIDHPHHRGIYWAWPEVEWGTERADLHALQRVFARPDGEVRLRSGPEVAEAEADNLWVWENGTPIVRERALLRAHRATERGRAVDLEFGFTALVPGVTVARRNTRLYGGLNVRLATPEHQAIVTHTDEVGTVPRRAWSDLSGAFQGTRISGLTILQHRDNPDYPGDWIQYPELSWCQPTFPAAGTRFPLRTDRTLVLRYRLWIHDGPAPSPEEAARGWDAYHSPEPGTPPSTAPSASPSAP